jgi:hypothetical protein
MPTEPGTDFYETILRYAALPVLALVIFLCWLVTNFLMSKKWQQERRNKQIRKAVAARKALLEQHRMESEITASDETKKTIS